MQRPQSSFSIFVYFIIFKTKQIFEQDSYRYASHHRHRLVVSLGRTSQQHFALRVHHIIMQSLASGSAVSSTIGARSHKVPIASAGLLVPSFRCSEKGKKHEAAVAFETSEPNAD